MNEKRLLEITSTVSMLDGPLVVLGYLSSLGESDMYLFLNYVKGSKYAECNYYDAIKLFSENYLKGKQVMDNNAAIEELGYYSEGNPEDYYFGSSFSGNYLENLAAMDDNIKIGRGK